MHDDIIDNIHDDTLLSCVNTEDKLQAWFSKLLVKQGFNNKDNKSL